MSGWLPVAWAEKAKVADVYERVIITMMAHKASPDGTGCFPSIGNMAEFGMCEETSIKRRLTTLQKRLVIAPGDQSLTREYDPRYRPKVYDLLIPFDWYSESQMEDVNRDRLKRGLAPLTRESRPRLALPPEKKKRSDHGVPRKPRKKASVTTIRSVS